MSEGWPGGLCSVAGFPMCRVRILSTNAEPVAGEALASSNIIQAMVRALRPMLKNPAKAEQILERFWRDKIALVWTVQDIHTAANEREVALTNQEAIKVLQELHHYHNKQYGLRWEDVTAYIEEYALGRKLTKRRTEAVRGKEHPDHQPAAPINNNQPTP